MDGPKEAAAETGSGQDTRPDVLPDGGPDADQDANDAGDTGTPDVPPDVPPEVPPDVPPEVSPDVPDADPDTGETGHPPLPDGGDALDAEVGGPPTLKVLASQHTIVLERCTNLLPATLPDVAAGAHTIKLTASTLSKGTVSDDDDNELPSEDHRVIVHVPVAAGQPASGRFFSVNGIGAMKNFSLSAVGTVRLMFIDSDASYNTGQGTVVLDGTGASATVDAMANVLAWRESCSVLPATVGIPDEGRQRVTLTASTLSVGGGSQDDYVLLRIPTEKPDAPFRYVILNGVGDSVDFEPYLDDMVRGWFISPTAGATGEATLTVTLL